jgi:hypothetical protein
MQEGPGLKQERPPCGGLSEHYNPTSLLSPLRGWLPFRAVSKPDAFAERERRVYIYSNINRQGRQPQSAEDRRSDLFKLLGGNLARCPLPRATVSDLRLFEAVKSLQCYCAYHVALRPHYRAVKWCGKRLRNHQFPLECLKWQGFRRAQWHNGHHLTALPQPWANNDHRSRFAHLAVEHIMLFVIMTDENFPRRWVVR